MSLYDALRRIYNDRKSGYWVLLDPDKLKYDEIPEFGEKLISSGVDAVLIGGSLIFNSDFETFVSEIKQYCGEIPVILFPGGVHQISQHADAILFLSLISGRAAQHLIGDQVMAAPLVYRSGIEPLATAYLLIDSGHPTSAQFMSGTIPLPRDKPDIVVAHALAAQYLGFKLIYLEAGSGATESVPEEIITAVSRIVNIPVIVGGGIKTPEEATKKVNAGATFIVTGNVLEKNNNQDMMHKFSLAVHAK